VYKEFYAHDHPAPELLSQAVYGLPEVLSRRDQAGLAHRLPGLLSHEHSAANVAVAAAGLVKPAGIIADSLSGVSGAAARPSWIILCRVQRERPPLWPAQAPAPLGNRAGTVTGSRDAGHPPVHTAFDSGESRILTTLYLAPAQDWVAAKAMDELGGKMAACYQAAYGVEPFVRLLEGKALPDTKNVVGTNVIEIAWRLDRAPGDSS